MRDGEVAELAVELREEVLVVVGDELPRVAVERVLGDVLVRAPVPGRSAASSTCDVYGMIFDAGIVR